MLKNYLITALRNINRNKVFSIINAIGLSVGIATAIIIYLYISHETNFDKHQTNYDKIYRIVVDTERKHGSEYEAKIPYPMVPALRNELTNALQVSRLIYWETTVVAYEDNKLTPNHTIYTEPELFSIFDFEWIVGSSEVIKAPDAAILSQSFAKKLFGNTDPINKLIKVGADKQFTVKAIVADPKEQTNIPYEIILPIESFSMLDMPFDINSWGTKSSGFFAYMLLPNSQVVADVEKQMNEIERKHNPDDESGAVYKLQPLSEIRTTAKYGSDNLNGYTDSTTLLIAAIVGLFVLILACINYINLSMSILLKRRKEIGVRKVNGASNKQLIHQFTIETLITITLSVIIAIVITELTLPSISNLLNGYIYTNVFSQPRLILFLLALIASLELVTGILPAVRVANYKAVNIFRGDKDTQGQKGFLLRSGLIIFQFLVTAALITSTLIIASQLNFLFKKDVRFTTKNILNLVVVENNKEQKSSIRTQIEALPDVITTSYSLGAPMAESNAQYSYQSPYLAEGERSLVNLKCTDYSYREAFDLQVVYGRWWNNESTTDSLMEFVVNETFIKKLGFPENGEAIGQKIVAAGNNGIIIGIVKDFHSQSLHSEIMPVVFAQIPSLYYFLAIRLADGFNPKTVDAIGEIWKAANPNDIWNYKFLDEYVVEQYKGDRRTFYLAIVASAMAIVIALLGLLGISGYTIQQKAKAVCIRKILGASVLRLIGQLSSRFLLLIAIANVIGLPLSYFAMKKWLNGFAYHIEISWYFFAATLLVSMLLSFLIIVYHTLRTVRENPATVLRQE
ncbi:MacB-like periplasmic core domain protein [anaerobic digester metagenome]